MLILRVDKGGFTDPDHKIRLVKIQPLQKAITNDRW